jgi:hypothetical protein
MSSSEAFSRQRFAIRKRRHGKLIEVFGDLREGRVVASRGTDELWAGMHVIAREASADAKSPAQ